MNLNVRFKGFGSSDKVRAYLEERTAKLKKFLPPSATINATLEDDKSRMIAEINLRNKGSDYVAKQTSDNLLTAIDYVVDKLSRQLSRAKERKRSRGCDYRENNKMDTPLSAALKDE